MIIKGNIEKRDYKNNHKEYFLPRMTYAWIYIIFTGYHITIELRKWYGFKYHRGVVGGQMNYLNLGCIAIWY